MQMPTQAGIVTQFENKTKPRAKAKTKLEPVIGLEDFREKVRNLEVECAVCHIKEHSLITHIRNIHSLTPAQYKKQFPNNKLCSLLVTRYLGKIDREPKPKSHLQSVIETFFQDKSTIKFEELSAKLPPFSSDLVDKIPAVDPFYDMPMQEANVVAYAIAMSRNLFIEGPTGCGKTELVKQVHALMKRPMQRVNMNGDITASHFLGNKQADSEKTFFQKGCLPNTMEGGYTLLCDEMDFTPPHIGAVLHPALEIERSIYLSETNETIKAKTGFTVVATANTGGKGDLTGVHTGVEILNMALTDRFPLKLTMRYPSQIQEKRMMTNRFPDIEENVILRIVSLAIEVREAFIAGNVGSTFSTRKLVDFGELYKPFGISKALDLVLLNWLEVDDLALVNTLVRKVGMPL